MKILFGYVHAISCVAIIYGSQISVASKRIDRSSLISKGSSLASKLAHDDIHSANFVPMWPIMGVQ